MSFGALSRVPFGDSSFGICSMVIPVINIESFSCSECATSIRQVIHTLMLSSKPWWSHIQCYPQMPNNHRDTLVAAITYMTMYVCVKEKFNDPGIDGLQLNGSLIIDAQYTIYRYKSTSSLDTPNALWFFYYMVMSTWIITFGVLVTCQRGNPNNDTVARLGMYVSEHLSKITDPPEFSNAKSNLPILSALYLARDKSIICRTSWKQNQVIDNKMVENWLEQTSWSLTCLFCTNDHMHTMKRQCPLALFRNTALWLVKTVLLSYLVPCL